MEEFGKLVFAHPPEARTLVRKIENISKKINNCDIAVVFNTMCIKENLLPKYTNIRLHDRAVQQKTFTNDFRKKLVEEQSQLKKTQAKALRAVLAETILLYEEFTVDHDLKQRTLTALNSIAASHLQVGQTRIMKKLSRLYDGPLAIPKPQDSFINLSSVVLTDAQVEFLNLGINCHLTPKFSLVNKKTHIALLFDSLCSLEREGKISIDPNLQEQLQAESTKIRHRPTTGLLSPRLREAAQQLRDNENIIIRRADKAMTYVILDRATYLSKCSDILQDTSKFVQISRNPTASLKSKVNSLLSVVNAVSGDLKFDYIQGDYAPGYFYGNVKTHKPGFPLRPIISQTPTPTYSLAKRLNRIISPYIPSTHSLRSTDEFIDILRSKKPAGFMASLDAESLFTNVPVVRTVDIILGFVYHHSELPPPKMPKGIMKELLLACTTEAPFRCPEGKLYVQKDGIAMGSPLGVLFAQAFMAYVENEALNNQSVKPLLYCRYIDDIFVCVDNLHLLEELRYSLQSISGLNFSVELNSNNTLPFLDVLVEAAHDDFVTSVYRKPTNVGNCMNGEGECSDTYKKGVIKAYVRRAISVCSSWHLLHAELQHLRQMLVNNGYSNTEFDKVTNDLLDRLVSRQTPHQTNDILVFYQNTYTNSYRLDEKCIKNIISKNCKPLNNLDVLKVIIVYKNPCSNSLVMKNNMSASPNAMSKTNVVYEYLCNSGDCASRNSTYIGHTTCSLSRRLTLHLQRGAIHNHHQQYHHSKLDRSTIVNNTRIISQANDVRKLKMLEAVFIRDKAPVINIQSNMVSAIPLFNNSTRHRRIARVQDLIGNPSPTTPLPHTRTPPPTPQSHAAPNLPDVRRSQRVRS